MCISLIFVHCTVKYERYTTFIKVLGGKCLFIDYFGFKKSSNLVFNQEFVQGGANKFLPSLFPGGLSPHSPPP